MVKRIRDDIVNKLAKDDLDLPLDPYSFGNLLLGSLVGGGGAFIALGIFFVKRSKRI